MQLAPYIFFPGTCEAALMFYAQALGGTITELNRFEGSPMAEKIPPEARQGIMHATLVAPGITLMASDGSEGAQDKAGIALSLGTKDVDEGRRAFEAISAGGTVMQPYEKMFWGASFGMCVDKFGVRWMVNAG